MAVAIDQDQVGEARHQAGFAPHHDEFRQVEVLGGDQRREVGAGVVQVGSGLATAAERLFRRWQGTC